MKNAATTEATRHPINKAQLWSAMSDLRNATEKQDHDAIASANEELERLCLLESAGASLETEEAYFAGLASDYAAAAKWAALEAMAA